MIAEFGVHKNGYYLRIENPKGKSVFYYDKKEISNIINSTTEKIDVTGAESILQLSEFIKLINEKNVKLNGGNN